MNSAHSQNPFLLVLLTVSLLGLLSFLKPGLNIGGIELRPVRLLADVMRPLPHLAAPTLTPEAADSALGPTVASQPAAADTARQGGLASFIAALRQVKAQGGRVRIAYFGDSMIEGDLITGELRNRLQEEFGGAGVGFVPIQSVAADFRSTIQATASANWRAYTLVSAKVPEAYPLGLSGHVFVPHVVPQATSTTRPSGALSWVDFRGGRPFARVRHLEQARLLYGPGAAPDQLLVTADGHASRYVLAGNTTVNELVIRPDSVAQHMRLAFATHAPRPVYGVSFEGLDGVTLDNFSFRGSNGMSLAHIPAKALAAFGPVQDYRLIILHYGVNIADAQYKSYAFYERAMALIVGRLQQAFPQASILIVGMSDKSSRHNGEFVTDPSVPRLLAAQQRLARRTHAAFWNLYEAMGGENAMVSWVENSPALANRDYTHVNSRGAHKIANLLFTHLMHAYASPRPLVGLRPTSELLR